MIDMINPIGLDLTKNLHGHVRVETRDRWTGKVVDSQEKDNLITNAVQMMTQTVPFLYLSGSPLMAGPFFNSYLPIYEKALGGIILFNGTLTESASNIYLPSDAKIVGMAGQTANTSHPLMGSYNGSESVFTSNGFTTVWDFATSQANGTIASIGRAPSAFANFVTNGWLVSIAQNATNTIPNPRWLGYDEANSYLYFAPTSSGTVDGVSYSSSQIYRAKVVFDKISLRWPRLPSASNSTLIKQLTSADGGTNASAFFYDKYANNFYTISGTTIHLLSIDGTHTTKTAPGITSGQYTETENYYWSATLNGTTIYRIEKSTTSNVQSFAIDYAVGGILPSENDIVYIIPSYPNNPTDMIYPDGTVLSLPYSDNSYSSHWVWRFSSTSSGGLRVRNDYLGTIANLDSPVTKTSSQTMKITYTLTEA